MIQNIFKVSNQFIKATTKRLADESIVDFEQVFLHMIKVSKEDDLWRIQNYVTHLRWSVSSLMFDRFLNTSLDNVLGGEFCRGKYDYVYYIYHSVQIPNPILGVLLSL